MRWGLTRTAAAQPCSSSAALTWRGRAPPQSRPCGVGLCGLRRERTPAPALKDGMRRHHDIGRWGKILREISLSRVPEPRARALDPCSWLGDAGDPYNAAGGIVSASGHATSPSSRKTTQTPSPSIGRVFSVKFTSWRRAKRPVVHALRLATKQPHSPYYIHAQRWPKPLNFPWAIGTFHQQVIVEV